MLFRSQRDDAGASALQPENRLASAARRLWGIRSLLWQPAKRSRKSPPLAREPAQTMSVSSLPDTNGLAASKSAMGNSTPHSRPRQSNTPRSDPGQKALAARAPRWATSPRTGTVMPRLHHISAGVRLAGSEHHRDEGASCPTNIAYLRGLAFDNEPTPGAHRPRTTAHAPTRGFC